MNKKGIITLVIIVVLLIGGGIWYYKAEVVDMPALTSTSTTTSTTTTSTTSSISYVNTQYGFTFALPASWQGYTIVTSTWKGNSVSTGAAIDQGPIISIRNPLWTTSTPTQDIPIMVFTLQQWSAVSSTEMAVSAAPIPPSELGQNSRYVFALPARYNYAYPADYQEVQDILSGNPLQASG